MLSFTVLAVLTRVIVKLVKDISCYIYMHVCNDGSFQYYTLTQWSRGLRSISWSLLYLKHTLLHQHVHLKPLLDVVAIIN